MDRIRYDRPLDDEEFEFPPNVPLDFDGQISASSAYLPFLYAWQYRDAAHILYSFDMPERVNRRFSPLFNNIGHCLELCFKSFCVFHDVELKWLKHQDNRHNLSSLMYKSIDLGLILEDDHRFCIEDLSPNFANHSYRYGEKPRTDRTKPLGVLPGVTDLMKAADTIVLTVADSIGMVRPLRA